MDDAVRRLIEPRAATVEERLDNLRRLVAAGVSCEARMDPLVPGLTDTEASLQSLLSELSLIGVREAVASFLFLRRGIKFPNDLTHGAWSSREMRRLYTHKVTDYCGGGTIYLPSASYRADRMLILDKLAAKHGLTIKLCRCKNSDLPEARCCHPTEPLLEPSPNDSQLRFL